MGRRGCGSEGRVEALVLAVVTTRVVRVSGFESAVVGNRTRRSWEGEEKKPYLVV
jgi:hypothetical protein